MPPDILQALLRCDLEIQEAITRPVADDKAYLRTLGACDWEYERHLILEETK